MLDRKAAAVLLLCTTLVLGASANDLVLQFKVVDCYGRGEAGVKITLTGCVDKADNGNQEFAVTTDANGLATFNKSPLAVQYCFGSATGYCRFTATKDGKTYTSSVQTLQKNGKDVTAREYTGCQCDGKDHCEPVYYYDADTSTPGADPILFTEAGCHQPSPSPSPSPPPPPKCPTQCHFTVKVKKHKKVDRDDKDHHDKDDKKDDKKDGGKQKFKYDEKEKYKYDEKEKYKYDAKEKYDFDGKEKYKYDEKEKYKYDAKEKYKYDEKEKYKYDGKEKYKYDEKEKYKYDAKEKFKYDEKEKYKYDGKEKYKYDEKEKYKYDVKEKYDFDGKEKHSYQHGDKGGRHLLWGDDDKEDKYGGSEYEEVKVTGLCSSNFNLKASGCGSEDDEGLCPPGYINSKQPCEEGKDCGVCCVAATSLCGAKTEGGCAKKGGQCMCKETKKGASCKLFNFPEYIKYWGKKNKNHKYGKDDDDHHDDDKDGKKYGGGKDRRLLTFDWDDMGHGGGCEENLCNAVAAKGGFSAACCPFGCD